MSYGNPQDGWQQPQNPPAGAPGANPYGQQFAQKSQATLALILSILGLPFCCGLLAPVGLFLGKKEVDAIDQGLADPAERGKAQAAFIIGIIGTALLVLAVFGWIVLSILG